MMNPLAGLYSTERMQDSSNLQLGSQSPLTSQQSLGNNSPSICLLSDPNQHDVDHNQINVAELANQMSVDVNHVHQTLPNISVPGTRPPSASDLVTNLHERDVLLNAFVRSTLETNFEQNIW
jgi:hypothetical protein